MESSQEQHMDEQGQLASLDSPSLWENQGGCLTIHPPQGSQSTEPS